MVLLVMVSSVMPSSAISELAQNRGKPVCYSHSMHVAESDQNVAAVSQVARLCVCEVHPGDIVVMHFKRLSSTVP